MILPWYELHGDILESVFIQLKTSDPLPTPLHNFAPIQQINTLTEIWITFSEVKPPSLTYLIKFMVDGINNMTQASCLEM